MRKTCDSLFPVNQNIATHETFTEILFDPIPHVIRLALAIDIDRPVTFILLDRIPQVILTGKYHVFAILTDVITIAVLFVSEVPIGLEREETRIPIVTIAFLDHYFIGTESVVIFALE